MKKLQWQLQLNDIYGNMLIKMATQFLKFNTLKFFTEKWIEHDLVYVDIETQIVNFSAIWHDRIKTSLLGKKHKDKTVIQKITSF